MGRRYNLISILFHWVMAVCILSLITLGLLMTKVSLEKYLQFQMYQWHKSLGVIVLLLFIGRFITRLVAQKPAPISGLSLFEQRTSVLGHWALYAMMFLLPFSGWLMVSASPLGFPTIVFGLFEWPHIPFWESNIDVENIAKDVHEILAYLFMILIAGHIGMVVKHWRIDGQNLLPRMGIGSIKKDT